MATVSDWLDTGLLPPCVVSAYLVLMCWQALTSNPNKSCEISWSTRSSSSSASDSSSSDKSVVANAIIAAFAMTWTGWRTSSAASDMFAKQPPPRSETRLTRTEKKQTIKSSTLGEPHFSEAAVVDVDDSGSTQPPGAQCIPNTVDAEPWQFYFMMLLAGLYMAMVLTDWDSADGYVAEFG